MISSAQIARIREASDIIAVVSQYVRLRRVGKEHAGLCPFHDERTPSFHASPERQSWICRAGCGGGDVIGFVRRIEGVSFPAAVRLLADRAGIQIEESRPTDVAAERRQRAHAEQLAAEAAWWWERIRAVFVHLENQTLEIIRRAELWLSTRAAAPDSAAVEYAWWWVANGGAIAARWRGFVDQIDEARPRELYDAFLAARRAIPAIDEQYLAQIQASEKLMQAWISAQADQEAK